MPKTIRTVDFVEQVKDLIRKGYDKSEVARRLAKEDGREKSYSYKLINSCIEEGPFKAVGQ
ncbi:hypothetical protein QMM61_15170 [Leptospira santarosai]|uniref:hypothetical protein n=1 Tax=Leptospira santarosai TaxID=28183 RepID=UPI0024AF2339|nr:hypothetical protein [Leptospira santarosai]MDI7198028.1 hypothetical protein [Leptospira santarosai]